MSRSAKYSSNVAVREGAMKRGARAAVRGMAGASLIVGFAAGAFAQQSDGMIAIPGNAETNPAAVAEMAKGLGSSKPVAAAAPAPTPAAVADVARASGYRAATSAADSAMRHAALALEAHAEAADDAMDDAGGLIVVPGPGEAKPAAATPAKAPVAVARDDASTARTVGTAAPALAKAPVSAQSRDVMPVVITRDDASSSAGARPIAAAAASPIRAANYSAAAAASPMKRVSFSPATAAAQTPAASATAQDGESIRVAALTFLQQQTAGLPGKVEITVTPVFPRGLAPCSALDPFMPTGARLWGRVTVGVRCVGERPWTLYVQARVSINATYYTAARAIAPGEVLASADLIARDGDLSAMPQAVVTDPSQAVGAVALSRVPAGLPLRTDMLRAASSVAIGQTVHVVADGTGFSISADGAAMNNAAPGQQVRVKTAGGQIITGIVKDSQTVEIRM
ncbi:flagellar basal body P-ring formation chaperone FlgA [Caballeronia sp. LZ062]|uniref:flagellar basal body P-ring formation chaperone FlgA n=1 Tax=unclassified Caballeronia TaxID=2646786 RepID=UPI00285B142F|nr:MULTISPECIES: flagellar basal body P-ring formation chaperone FlgA [unclassified Caballeronia]MDR5855844.1 flagellar basal body P-ring formation chaperone FlgA [Caballeronia sp. LZ050]MDR5872370.1 flagellar basal body P-ring formation chaperone FlgA [Caballeronia sp. LZ062]